MTDEQLTMDGELVPYPLPKAHRLTERQRELLRYMRAALLDDRRMATRHAGMFYTDASGALRRLEKLGLVERVARGYWRAR